VLDVALSFFVQPSLSTKVFKCIEIFFKFSLKFSKYSKKSYFLLRK